MSFLTLDIETVPQARFTDSDSFASGDLDLDEQYLEEMHHETGTLRFEIENGVAVLAATKAAAALHPTTCHIVQVSFGWRTSQGTIETKICQLDDYGPDVAAGREEALLQDAMGTLHRATAVKRTRLVTFNGKQFDLPVLRARVALLRLKVPAIPWRRLLYPYSDDQHADLRLILGADDRRARGTLQHWADAFGIHAEEHGADVFGWVQAGEWGKLRTYGNTEALTLVELFEAVEGIL